MYAVEQPLVRDGPCRLRTNQRRRRREGLIDDRIRGRNRDRLRDVRQEDRTHCYLPADDDDRILGDVAVARAEPRGDPTRGVVTLRDAAQLRPVVGVWLLAEITADDESVLRVVYL